jgi:hypothetical protein
MVRLLDWMIGGQRQLLQYFSISCRGLNYVNKTTAHNIVRIAQSLVLSIVSSSKYGFWLPLWYLQTLLCHFVIFLLTIALYVFPRITSSDNPFVSTNFPRMTSSDNPLLSTNFPRITSSDNPLVSTNFPGMTSSGNPLVSTNFPRMTSSNNPLVSTNFPRITLLITLGIYKLSSINVFW